MSDLSAYVQRPREELACIQAQALYRDGYITLAAAKGLAKTHGGYLANHINWNKVSRNQKGQYEKRRPLERG